MSRDAFRRPSSALFRRSAMAGAVENTFGAVSVILPPSSTVAVLISFVAVAALVWTTRVVDVPQRARAIGVLMPAGGLVDVVARQSGQVERVLIDDGVEVAVDDLLLTTGDAAFLRGESASQVQLESLKSELSLSIDAWQREEQIGVGRIRGLEDELQASIRQLHFAEQRLDALGAQRAILEKRLTRWQPLVGEGHVSSDAFETEQFGLFGVHAEHAEFQQATLALAQRVQSLRRRQSEAGEQLALDKIQHDIRVRQLRRDIKVGRHEILQEYRVSRASIVAQVLVQPGETVLSGQVLARLRRPDDRLQAWMYLPAARARTVSVGQSVEISLDAYPPHAFGTHTAVVTTVSDIALLPRDVRALLVLPGPVFEIRAELVRDDESAVPASWPLAPGISFKAEIIQRRQSLYEWLFRTLSGGSARDFA